jgi:hypothetical protein
MTDTFKVTICATGTLVGATVSALVYSTLATTGDLTASLASSSISTGGELVAKGAELIAGPIAGSTIRAFTKTGSTLVKPAIENSSRTTAAGVSVLAGAGAALTTSAIIYGTKGLGNLIYKYTTEYIVPTVMTKIQYPIEAKDEEINAIATIDDID